MNIMDFAWHDDQFLFRLTSTFGWEEAVVICDELVTGIENASLPSSASIPNQDGTVHISSSPSIFNDALRFSQSTKCESLDDWIKLAKSQLMHQDQWGNTPLHAALYVHPPVHVIDALFRVGRSIYKYSHDLPEVPIWAVLARDHSTPFLVACSTGTSIDGLQRYLDEIDYYIEQEWALSRARILVLQPDNQGTTPLMGWMTYHHQFITCHLKLGVGRLLTSYDELVTRMVWFATQHINISLGYPITRALLLHRCTLIARHFPHQFLDFMFLTDPSSIAMVRDDDNRLPLHNAIDADEILPVPFDSSIHISIDDTGPLTKNTSISNETNRITMLEKILTWNPNCARVNCPSDRTSPLCKAIMCGDRWHARSKKPDRRFDGVIKKLFEHAPDKLGERDTLSGLYPFMLAATIPMSARSAYSDETEMVETVYQLLRNNPQPFIDSL